MVRWEGRSHCETRTVSTSRSRPSWFSTACGIYMPAISPAVKRASVGERGGDVGWSAQHNTLSCLNAHFGSRPFFAFPLGAGVCRVWQLTPQVRQPGARCKRQPPHDLLSRAALYIHIRRLLRLRDTRGSGWTDGSRDVRGCQDLLLRNRKYKRRGSRLLVGASWGRGVPLRRGRGRLSTSWRRVVRVLRDRASRRCDAAHASYRTPVDSDTRRGV